MQDNICVSKSLQSLNVLRMHDLLLEFSVNELVV